MLQGAPGFYCHSDPAPNFRPLLRIETERPRGALTTPELGTTACAELSGTHRIGHGRAPANGRASEAEDKPQAFEREELRDFDHRRLGHAGPCPANPHVSQRVSQCEIGIHDGNYGGCNPALIERVGLDHHDGASKPRPGTRWCRQGSPPDFTTFHPRGLSFAGQQAQDRDSRILSRK